MIYLDNAASTRIHHNVYESMLPYLQDQYGNASSIHRFGRLNKKAIEKARKQIASLIGAQPSEIFFTSGGTESNNAVLNGSVPSNGGHIITSSVEHDAILEPCKRLSDNGTEITYLPVDKFGMIDTKQLEDKISTQTNLVSIMFGNNEVGTIQPILEISKICRNYDVPFHTDAVQVVGKLPIDVNHLGIDLMSVSSHKLYGPKGIGALFVRNGLKISPFILGGGQEHGFRSGTESVPNIVGFGTACELAQKNIQPNLVNLQDLQESLITQILREISFVTLNGHPKKRIPNNTHFTFLGVNGEDLIIKLDEYGIAASTGSACSINTQKASHVLQAMNFSHEQITGSLRLSLGIFNTQQEINETIKILKKTVEELRSVSPYKDKYSF